MTRRRDMAGHEELHIKMGKDQNIPIANTSSGMNPTPLVLNKRQPHPRPIAAIDGSHALYYNRSTIQLLPIQGQDYEIKPQIFVLVKQHLFHELFLKSPIDHIENLEENYSTTNSNRDFFTTSDATR
ncbi:hypothetical protein Bca4012_055591 [Brassica carinata]